MSDADTFIDPEADFGQETVGPYKLLQPLGEGGMGSVYMAEQQEPVRRRVALKLIKAGMDSRQVIARFEAERQALAMMDHQNIARVLDAGTTEDERPYFVMELVQGIPITDYCDRNQLTLQDRLQLLIPVCHAIQHAHQKGIIHRDIKPSNILVTLYDGVPVPKVIDFGLAKALQQRLTERTMFTQFGQVVGTLEYMSPEQAEMNALDVDTRTDVYSLGVLMYELLTGSTPLQRQTVRERAFDQVLRIIREDDPPRPSSRLSESGDRLPGISKHRRLDPRRLSQTLKGDLDWIAMKALEKDRSRRYGTCSDLADDMQRFLAKEPIEARPPSASYRMQKFLRKHVMAVGVAAAFLCVLVATTAISISQAINAANSERDAIAARSEMEEALRQAQELEKLAQASARKARLESMEGSVAIEVFREVLIGLLQAEDRKQAKAEVVQEESTWQALRQTIDSSPRLSRGLADTIKLVKPMSTTLAASSAVADVAGNLSMLDQVEDNLQLFLSPESEAMLTGAGGVLDFDESLKQGTNAVTLSVLTTVALVRQNFEQAQDYARREIDIRKNIDSDDWRLFFAYAQRADASLGLEDRESARTDLTIAWNGLSQFRDQIPEVVRQRRLAHVLEQLSSTCQELGDQTAAKTWQIELAKLRAGE
ncbi:MAG: serine/threonine protein kinase [Planctomycetaceae bacterium]|nr:serine/threonine protein kinase [Planctomycetaceae bacterium]